MTGYTGLLIEVVHTCGTQLRAFITAILTVCKSIALVCSVDALVLISTFDLASTTCGGLLGWHRSGWNTMCVQGDSEKVHMQYTREAEKEQWI